MYPQQPDYPPDYIPGNRWMPRVHSGFRYFLIALVVLTVGGYFTGNPYLVPNIFMSVFSQFQPHSATAPIAQTTDGTTVISPEDSAANSTSSSTLPPVPQHQMQTTASTTGSAMNTTGDPVAVSSTMNPPVDSTNSTTASHNGPMTITTTVVPVPHNGSSQAVATTTDLQPVSSTTHHTHTHIDSVATPPHTRRVMASLASDNPTVPDGWYTWSVQKRARYVRALMSRIDAP